MKNIELLIQNGNTVYQPVLEGGITWDTERTSTPGKLTFKVIQDGSFKFSEGNPVRLKIDNNEVFYGFIFTIKRTKEKEINITAYDQLRYFKNKDTYVYSNKTASAFIRMLANDFFLNLGEIEETSYIIPSRVEENQELFEMIKNALSITLQNKKEMYVLYDKFGKLTLKNIRNMLVPILIDEETGGNYDYQVSIDSNVYNKIKLTYDNEDTGKREVFIAQDTKNINNWGVLQYFEKLQKNENGQAKANALLSLYNKKQRKLSISDVIGDLRVRAGSLIPIKMNLGDINVLQLMIVEKCSHTFDNNQHFMKLTLRGSDFDV